MNNAEQFTYGTVWMDICEVALKSHLLQNKLMFPKGKTFVQDHRLGIKSSLAEISVTLLEPYTLYPLKDGMSVC